MKSYNEKDVFKWLVENDYPLEHFHNYAAAIRGPDNEHDEWKIFLNGLIRGCTDTIGAFGLDRLKKRFSRRADKYFIDILLHDLDGLPSHYIFHCAHALDVLGKFIPDLDNQLHLLKLAIYDMMQNYRIEEAEVVPYVEKVVEIMREIVDEISTDEEWDE